MAKGKKSAANVKRSPLQAAGAKFVDELSSRAVTALKSKLGLNTEENYIDANLSTTATTTMASRLTFPSIPQGNGVSTRIGRSVRITRIELRLQVAAAATATTGNTTRVICTRNTNAGVAIAAQTLASTTVISSPIVVDTVTHDNGVYIMDDFTIETAAPAGGISTAWYQHTYRSVDWHLTWPSSDTAGTPAATDCGVFNIFWMVDAIATAAPIYTGSVRVWYVDN